nr:peptidase S1C, peptidase S1, PA clan [Tanacetum cinerariifolium]
MGTRNVCICCGLCFAWCSTNPLEIFYAPAHIRHGNRQKETIPSMVCIKDLEPVDNPKSSDEVVTKKSYRSMLKGLK